MLDIKTRQQIMSAANKENLLSKTMGDFNNIFVPPSAQDGALAASRSDSRSFLQGKSISYISDFTQGELDCHSGRPAKKDSEAYMAGYGLRYEIEQIEEKQNEKLI